MFKNPIEGALYMFDLGMKVFPLIPNDKTPAIKNWQAVAEKAKRDWVESYGRTNPNHNWGVSCGPSRIIVVDLDEKIKNGIKQEGIKNYSQLTEDKHDNTFTVLTPSGGKHLYYLGEGSNTTSFLAKSIDTRGQGGYVVAPGSRIDTQQYEIEKKCDMSPLPPIVIKVLTEKKKELKVLEKEVLVTEGERNSTLLSLAGSMRSRGMSYDAIYAALTEVNSGQLEIPLPEIEVESIARSISKYKPNMAEAAAAFTNITPRKAVIAADINFTETPKRDWVMHSRYIGKFISVLISPGGQGKSTLAMLDAVAVATGKPLTGYEVTGPGAVWIYNTEDPIEELYRRLEALCKLHKVKKEALQLIHLTSGRDDPLILVREEKGKLRVNEKLIRSTIQYIEKHNIRLFIVDPFVRTHEVSENDNMQIDRVMWCFQRIAEATRCAVCLVHHTNKTGGVNNEINMSRGASAFINAARVAHVVSVMTDKEAEGLGISSEKRVWYLRLVRAKANLSAPRLDTLWYKRVSVTLSNTENAGAIEVENIKSIQYTKLGEKEHMAKRDIIHILGKKYKVGDTPAVSMVVKEITRDPKFAHLLRPDSMIKSKGIMVKLLREGLSSKGKTFTYVHYSDRQVKHVMVVKSQFPFLN